MGGTQVWLFLLWAPNIFFLILCQVSIDVIILRTRKNMLRPSDCLHVICCSCLVFSALGIELRASVILDKHFTAEIWSLLFIFTQSLFKLTRMTLKLLFSSGWSWTCDPQPSKKLVLQICTTRPDSKEKKMWGLEETLGRISFPTYYGTWENWAPKVLLHGRSNIII